MSINQSMKIYVPLLFASLSCLSAARPPHQFRLRVYDSEGGASHWLEESSSYNKNNLPNLPKQSPARFRKGKSRRGLMVVEDTIEERAEKYFNGKGLGLPGEHYRGQYSAFRDAMKDAYRESQSQCGKKANVETINKMAKTLYMRKIAQYQHVRLLWKGRERLKRVNKLETTLEEFEQLKKHFINPNPPRGDTPLERKQQCALRVYYRTELAKGNRNILRVMENKGWTMDDLKLYTMPPNDQIIAYLNYIRSGEGQGEASTSHVAIPVGRSNPDLDIDLNEPGEQLEQVEEDEDDRHADLDLQLDDLQLERGSSETLEDDLNRSTYHEPFPGAYDGRFYKAFPSVQEGEYYQDSNSHSHS